MSYQVLARKYRPQRFEEVVGQEHVTQTLVHAIEQNRIAHAYLFAGPRGTGKTTIARIFAKCLNATGGPKVDFSDDDERCQEITQGRSLDVLEIDGASNRGIEEIRELRETVRDAPASSKFKIYIIDEVHMLTKEAFNALLKTLEEPPAHVKFMFATTEPEKVLATILSRCQRFDLRRISSRLIVDHLAHIANLEKVKIDEPALFAIARGADGCMRDAESTLDQLISFCGEEITEPDVLSMFGLTARSQILALVRAMLEGKVEPALRELNDLANHGKDLGRLLADLLNHFRNLLVYAVSRGDLSLIEVSEAEAGALKEQSALASPEALTRIMEVLTGCEGRLRDALSKKILIEVSLLKAIQARSLVSIDTVLKQLQQLRTEAGPLANLPAPAEITAAAAPVATLANSSPSAPLVLAEKPRPHSSSPSEAKAPSAASPLIAHAIAQTALEITTAEELESIWARIVEAAGRASPFTKTYLLEAHPVSFVKGVFTIGFDPEFADHLGLVDTSKTRTLLQTKMHELGLGQVQIKFIQAEAPPGRGRPTFTQTETPDSAAAPPSVKSEPDKKRQSGIPLPAKLDPETFKNDPLIKQALEIFKGQIVDVRA